MDDDRTKSGPAIRVFVVEDDPETRQRIIAVITADPRTTLAASAGTGQDAVRNLVHAHPDVLLVDLGLPDISGLEVIRQGARLLPDTDIMVITMFGDEAHVLASIESGATGYLLKDCPDTELIDHIVELRAGGSPINPIIARRLLTRMRAEPKGTARTSERADAEASLLTARETEVLQLIAKGFTYAEVAKSLAISLHTVTSHIKNAYRKLAVSSGPAAVARATALGLLQTPNS
jgi:DNA-binding NarL/FixJ family response regulator